MSNKFDELNALITEMNVDVCVVTESWLKDS